MCKVSIILVNFRNVGLTLDCIRSIQNSNTRTSYEIIIVDNNSQDGSIEKLNEIKSNSINVIESNTNGGFAYGNNLGIKEAKGEYIFLLNNDTIVYPGTIDGLLNFAENNPQIGVLGCRAIDNFGEELSVSHSFESPKRLLVQLIIKPILEKLNLQRKVALLIEGSKKSDWEFRESDWVTGAAMFIKKNVYCSSRGLDSNFFMYMEDEDLCKRIQSMGYINGILNIVGYKHFCGGSSIASYFLTKEYIRSRVLFFRRYYNKMFKIWKIFLFLQIRTTNPGLSKIDVLCIRKEINEYIISNLEEQSGRVQGLNDIILS